MKKLSTLFIAMVLCSFAFAQQLTTPMQFLVNGPAPISGEMNYGYPVNFGPTTISTVTGDLEWGYSGPNDSLGCTTITTNLTGKVALIRRGACNFSQKVYESQLQGAVGCVILNNAGTYEISNMNVGSGGPITIPSVFLSFNDGEQLLSVLNLGNTVNVSFFVPTVNDAVLSFAKNTPLSQIIDLTNMRTDVYNNGTAAVNGVTATLDISNPIGAISSYSATIPTISASSEANVAFPGVYTPTMTGVYTGVFKSSLNPSDSVIRTFVISNNTFALDNNNISNAQGNAESEAGFAGNSFIAERGAIYRTGASGFNGTSITSTFALENAGAYLGEAFTLLLYQAPAGGFTGSETDYSTFLIVGGAQHIITVADTLTIHTLITDTLVNLINTVNLNTLNANTEYMLVIKYQGNGSIVAPPRYSTTHNEQLLWISQTVYTNQLFMGGWIDSPQPILRLRLNDCTASTSTDTHSACDSYTWIDGNNYTANNTTATHTLTDATGCDSIVTLNLTVTNATSFTQSFTECDGDSIVVGTSTYSVDGTYIDTLANAAGCDSIVTTNLTITPVNNTVIDLSPLLVAQSTTGTFQWVDCDNGNAIIPGETGQSFTPTATGNYAVQVTENGCTLQSTCYTIISTAGQSEMNSENIVVYPNPTKGWFTLESNQIGSDFLLTTIDGKIIMKGAIENKNQKIDLSEEVDGVYMLQVLGESGTSIIKVVKK